MAFLIPGEGIPTPMNAASKHVDYCDFCGRRLVFGECPFCDPEDAA